MSAVAAAKKRGLARVRRVLGERRSRRLRSAAFRTVQRARGMPLLRTRLALALADGRRLLVGTLVDPGDRIERIELLRRGHAPEDITASVRRFDDGPSLYRGMVAPGAPIRFAVLTAPPADADAPEPHAVALTLAGGRRVRRRLPRPRPVGEPLDAVRRILGLVPPRSDDKRALFDAIFGPAIGAIWEARAREVAALDIVEHHPELAAAEPEVSLVIPIYGRYDFIEHQIAQFVDDPDMRRHEILFVIDDPRLDAEVRASCETLARIYPLHVRVLHLTRNLGYAGANNAAVAAARGRHVLLLNSDVMPLGPGWLRRLLDAAGERLEHGVVGARLIYEDGSVQHDGMRFFASPFLNGLWTNVHPAKGIAESALAARPGVTPRQSVTGACLLVSRDNYLRTGGLDERYILGDFEDSDFCLAARRLGLDVVLAEEVVLYHLERQSQSLVSSDRWKEELTYYNCWQHTVKWDADIRALVAEGDR